MKSQKKTVLFVVLTLLWTVVIFSFSLQPAKVSAGMSGSVLEYILDWFYKLTGILLPADLTHTLIRKTAHFCEFFLLGIFARQATKRVWKAWWPALCYGALVAVCDECLQYLAKSGRAMRVTDMLLDTAGVATAILLSGIIAKRVANKKHKNTEKSA